MSEGKEYTETITFDKTNHVKAASPFKIYQIKFNSTLDEPCTSKLCTCTSSLAWYSELGCHANFMCTVMNGNACGDFGIQLSHKNSSKTDICNKNKIFTKQLSSLDYLTIDLWHTPTSRFDVVCHAWCSSRDGSNQVPPKQQGADVVLQPLLEDIALHQVDKTVTFERIELGIFNEEHPMSKYKVYQLDQVFDGFDECQVEKCYKKYDLSWRNRESCQLTFYCTKLWRNPCSEFGISVGVPSTGFQQEACSTNRVISSVVPTNQYLEILLWYLPFHEYHLTCNFWCTPTGALPQAIPSNLGTSQSMLQKMVS